MIKKREGKKKDKKVEKKKKKEEKKKRTQNSKLKTWGRASSLKREHKKITPLFTDGRKSGLKYI